MFSTTSSFILFFCPQGTATYPFSQKGKRIKKEKPIPSAYNCVFGESISTKIKGKRVKRQIGKSSRIRSGTLSPSYDTNRGRPPIQHPGSATFHCIGRLFRSRPFWQSVWGGLMRAADGSGGFRLSSTASREGRRGPGRDDGVCLSAS